MLGVRQSLSVLVAGVSALIAALALTAAPAVAADAPDRQQTAAPAAVTHRYLEHYQSDRCLDGLYTSALRLTGCLFNDYQRWIVSNDEWKHYASGLCLDGSASQGVRLNTCNGGSYQDWAWDGRNFKNKTGLCLDGSISQGVRMTACVDNNPYQVWLVRP